MNFDYLSDKDIFITPSIGYINAKFIDDNVTKKVLCYSIDGKTPIIFNPIRYYSDSLIGDTIDNASVESDTYIATQAGAIFENRTELLGFISKKNYGSILLKQVTGPIPNRKKSAGVPINSVSGTSLSAEFNQYYRFDDEVNTLAISLPSTENVSEVKTIIISFTAGSTPNVTITPNNNETVDYFKDYSIEASTEYEINIIWNGSKWVVAQGVIE